MTTALELALLQLLSDEGTSTSLLHRLKVSLAKAGRRNPNMARVLRGERNGMYGVKMSAESRAKMAEAKRGERNPNYGRPHSAKHRDRIAASCRRTKRALKAAREAERAALEAKDKEQA